MNYNFRVEKNDSKEESITVIKKDEYLIFELNDNTVGGDLRLSTGLQDKNEVEIFHGDEIKDEAGNVGIVIWDEELAGFQIDVLGVHQDLVNIHEWGEIV